MQYQTWLSFGLVGRGSIFRSIQQFVTEDVSIRLCIPASLLEHRCSLLGCQLLLLNAIATYNYMHVLTTSLPKEAGLAGDPSNLKITLAEPRNALVTLVDAQLESSSVLVREPL